MRNDPQALVAGLEERENVTDLWTLTDERIARGDAGFVAELGIALWRRFGAAPHPPWQYRSIFDRVVRRLALSPGTVAEAVLMLAELGGGPARLVAALLASGHRPGELADALGGAAPPELRACLLHELAVRHAAVEVTWADEAWWPGHPLAWLPPALTPMEGYPEVVRYRLEGNNRPAAPEISTAVEGEDGPVPAARETTSEERSGAVEAAVRNWAATSNGRVESRSYDLEAPLPPTAVAAFLRGLDLPSTRGLDVVGATAAPPVWEQLFVAASAGGAYSTGEYGAYGRLAAWRSVAGLLGAPAGASAAEVEALARRGHWYGYTGATGWFARDGWDIGVAVVTPDGRRLALLSATDTD